MYTCVYIYIYMHALSAADAAVAGLDILTYFGGEKDGRRALKGSEAAFRQT